LARRGNDAWHNPILERWVIFYWLEWLLGFAHMLLGPVVWGFAIFLMIKGRERMLLVKHPLRALPEKSPHVTILVPAKDEQERIRDCIESALRQDYPSFDVIAINDRSDDDTGKVLDQIASENSRLKVIHIPHGNPPAGWTGKNNALQTGTRHAAGEWLLFVDSDVILQASALRGMVSECIAREFDMVSLLLRLESHGFWEGLLVPLAGAAVSILYFAPLTNSNDWPKVAFGNGQCMCFKRSVYDAIEGHASVRDKYCEDMAFARLLKRKGFRPRVSYAIDFAAVRMYSSFSAIIRGWSRIFFASGERSLARNVLAILFLIFCGLSAYAALAWGVYRNVHPAHWVRGWLWIVSGGIHLALMMYAVGLMYEWTGNRRRNAVLFPLSAVLLIWIFIRAIQQCITGKVTWRGTSYGRKTT
jgi:cellulose synthase/poly-beta-1,6-N-acetylglucosamine synthase-like glycosyltransferase